MEKYRWMKTDTASIMFSCLSTKQWGRTFRMAVILNEDVQPEVLKKAVADLATRHPSMYTHLKKGFFWNYQEGSVLLPEIREEFTRPLLPITYRNDGRPDFRIVYYKKRLALETAHTMGDGMGVNAYFNALLIRYFELCDDFHAPYNPVPFDEQEIDNAFNTFYQKNGAKDVEPENKAYQLEGKIEHGFLQLIFAMAKTEELVKKAKEKGLTVTEYLTVALILGTIRAASKPINEPVTIAIPVNLRRFFPTKSVRNFTIQSRIDFNPEGKKDYTFDEICAAVSGQLKKRLEINELQKILNNFGSLANNPVLGLVPNFIKQPVLRARQAASHGNNTTILTNTGESELSPELKGKIIRADGVNGDTSGYGLISTCSALSCNGIFNLCFSICSHDTTWARECVRVLTEQGLNVRIESTYGNGEK